MKNFFRVGVYRKDYSRNTYNVLAGNDVEARKKATKADEAKYSKDDVDYPGISYCEIAYIDVVDIG